MLLIRDLYFFVFYSLPTTHYSLVMSLVLYNSLTKRNEEFTPHKPPIVTMYTCGPTVYGRPHIGNYSSFLMADLLRRWLEVGHNYTVKYAKNITDVGHLVADADDGEDKIEKQARLESGSSDPHSSSPQQIDPLAIAKRYTAMYLEDEKALNILEPSWRPRATEYIKEMLTMTKILIEKGNAYETDDGVYFSVETFKDYGKLSGNTLDKLNAGARVAVDEAKRHPADFALWKKCVGSNGHHILRWSFVTGERTTTVGDDPGSGFPGWHIECSAMSSALLGEQIDIHTGGEDNIFPHHECEIAQSECCSGKQFVQLWLHKRRIEISNRETLRQAQDDSPEASQKMSKSLGNVLSIPDLIAKGYSPLDVRFYFLSVHYRTNLKFSFEGLDNARKTRLKIVEWMEHVQHAKPGISSKVLVAGVQAFQDQFKRAMDEDLNTSGALAEIFHAMHSYYSASPFDQDELHQFLAFIQIVRVTFGCFESEVMSIPADVQKLLDARALARKNKDFKESDRLRDEMKKLGYEVRDTGAEQVVKKL